jgi:Flp pilus assembly protein TadG
MTKPVVRRRGAAAVELAILLPFLVFLFIIAVDWARVFYYSVTCQNCARNGALWASDPVAQQTSPYTSLNDAALADASNLSPSPTVSSTTGVDSNGASYIDVTVTYQFQTVSNFPGVPQTTPIVSTVRMNMAPTLPR